MREGWTYKTLGEVCKTTSGGTPSKAHSEYYEGGTIPWLRSGEVKQGAIFEPEMFITEEGLNNSSAKIVPEDSVAVAMYGATVGQVGIIKAPMCTNQAICCILPSKELLPDYLFRFLSSKKEEYLKNAIGGAQPNISQAEIKKTLVSIPPLTTQQQIVSELDLLSHILDQKRQQLKEYDALAESIFYDMFGAPSSQTIFECKKLSEITKSCGGGTPSKAHPEYWNGGIPWVSSKDMKSMYIGDSQMHITQEGVDNSAAKLLPIGTILLVTRSGILKHSLPVAITTAEITINQDLKALIVNPSICISVFLLYCLKAYAPYLLGQTKAVTVDSIDFSVFKNLTIPLPPLTLQRSFASKIESIEHQKQLLRASIKETEMLFQSRMDYWFNG